MQGHARQKAKTQHTHKEQQRTHANKKNTNRKKRQNIAELRKYEQTQETTHK